MTKIKKSLSLLLDELTALDQELEIEIDPASLIGDIRSKVDDTKEFIDFVRARSASLSEKAKRLQKAARSLEANAVRCERYFAGEMGQRNFEKLPGDVYYARLQDSTPSFKILRYPTELDLGAHPEYCRESRAFFWNEEKIEADIVSGKLVGCDFASVTRGKHVRFYVETSGGRKGLDP